MKIALISDNLTYVALQNEGDITPITPLNYQWQLRMRKFDFLLIESAWEGFRGKWKYKIAAYSDVPKRNNIPLQKVISLAREKGIKVIFWNKEDSVHFERFIKSASLCDKIFTVDENAIPHYKEKLGEHFPVFPLMFAIQPKIHFYTGFNPKYNRANFVGSYSNHVHFERKKWQDMMFKACEPIGLTVYDRNSHRKSNSYRIPHTQHIEVKPAVPYDKTAELYRDYLISLNCNTITDSNTMFSRRLIEILAVGGIAVTNSSLAVSRHFAEFCTAIDTKEVADEFFHRLKKDDLTSLVNKAKAGADYVARNFTWKQNLERIYSYD